MVPVIWPNVPATVRNRQNGTVNRTDDRAQSIANVSASEDAWATSWGSGVRVTSRLRREASGDRGTLGAPAVPGEGVSE